jgi:hypothetical protein
MSNDIRRNPAPSTFWLGASSKDADFTNANLIDHLALLPNKIRAVSSFNPPYIPVLLPLDEIKAILIGNQPLRGELIEYANACIQAREYKALNKRRAAFSIPWDALYTIDEETQSIIAPPLIDEINLRVLYLTTIEDRSSGMGQLIELSMQVQEEHDAYCKYLLDGRISEIPVEYIGFLKCGIDYGIDPIYEFLEPSAPLNVRFVNGTSTSVNIAWDPPFTFNIAFLDEPVTFPFIETYEIQYNTTNTDRFGGLISDVGTTFTEGQTIRDVNFLNPGHTYAIKIRGKNFLNPAFGEYSIISSNITFYPNGPLFLQGSDSTEINYDQDLNIPYGQNGSYTLDGIEYVKDMINFDQIVPSTTITTTITPSRRNNYIPGVNSDSITGTITGKEYNTLKTVDTVLSGFNESTSNGTFTNADSTLSIIISNDSDFYAGEFKDSGFWKSYQVKLKVFGNTIQPNKDIYKTQIFHDVTDNGAGLTVNSGIATYGVDNIDQYAVIDSIRIHEFGGISPSTFSYISGVPSFSNQTVFNVQFNINDLANYFLRDDKKHAEIYIRNENGQRLSEITTITKDIIDNITHSYYTPNTSFSYNQSIQLGGVNNSGTTLVAGNISEYVQFNDFSLTFDSTITNIFSANTTISVTPFNIYGVGISQHGGVIDPVSGLTLGNIRLDGASINTVINIDNSSGINGKHIKGGKGQFPIDTEFELVDYDHIRDISLDSNNSEAQLINGTFSAPGLGEGYRNYNDFFYWAGTSGIITPDYSVLGTDQTYYVTFYHKNLLNNSKGISLRLLESIGIDEILPDDIELHVKVVNNSTNKYVQTTNWLNANKYSSAIGVHYFTPNGGGALDYSSSIFLKHIYVPNGISGDVYVRLGIKGYSLKRFKYFAVYNVPVHTQFNQNL